MASRREARANGRISFSLDIFLHYDGSFAKRCRHIKRKKRESSQT